MKKYCCQKCAMEIKPLTCAKCNCEMEDKEVEKNGKKIHVAECSKCHGMVKAPCCCGTDMKCS